MTTTNQNTNSPEPLDTVLDDAALEALSAHSPEESAAFIQRLALADPATRQAARQLKETVARMATASPYMDPPSDLRGKILQATAPKAFKIEDYRKRGEMAPVWQRWGLVAAVLFLTASAYYTATLKKDLALANNNLAVATHRADTLAKNYTEVQGVVTAMVEDKALKIPVFDDKHEKVGVLLQNKETKQLALIMPKTNVPENMVAYITIDNHGKTSTLPAVPVGQSLATAPLTASPVDITSPAKITTHNNGVTYNYATK